MDAYDEDEDWDDREDDPCDHDDYDADLLSGRCHCWRCGHSWYATAEQLDAQLRWESEYHEAMEREYRREWWRTLPARLWAKAWEPFRRKPPMPADDPEIPF